MGEVNIILCNQSSTTEILTIDTFVLDMNKVAGDLTSWQQFASCPNNTLDLSVTKRRDFLILVIHNVTLLFRRGTRVDAAITVNQFGYQNGGTGAVSTGQTPRQEDSGVPWSMGVKGHLS